MKYIGKSFNRVEGEIKANGTHKYPSDTRMEGMLVLGVRRAEVPHAIIKNIDLEEAKKMPGIVAIFTAKDVPGTNRHGIMTKDEEILVESHVRMIGDPIALVAGETKEQVDAAVKAIKVDYDLLPVVRNPFEGLKEDAPKIHENGNLYHEIEIVTGEDVEKAIKEADVVVKHRYAVPHQEHMPIETESGYGYIDEDGKIAIFAGTQYIYRDVQEIEYGLGLKRDEFRVAAPYFGGGFGGKDGITVQCHIALAVMKLRRPVRIHLERTESINSMYHRHPAYMEYTTAAKKDGTLVACDAKIYFDKGAYAGLGLPVINLASEHFAGPYRIPNTRVHSCGVYTNNPTCSAFRGFGETQTVFAVESQIDLIAEKLGMDPLEIRKKNCVEQYDKSCIGHTLIYSTGIKECIEAIEKTDLYKNRDKYIKAAGPHKKRGIGMGLAYQGGGMGVNIPDYAKGKIELLEDGEIIVYGGITDMGQGNTTAYVQIAAEIFNTDRNNFRYTTPDSKYTLDSGSAAASRTTYIYGKAIDGCARIMRDKMLEVAVKELKVSKDDLHMEDARVISKRGTLTFSDLYQLMDEEDRIVTNHVDCPQAMDRHDAGEGLPHIIYSYAAHLALVETDELTGKVDILRYITSTDAGKVLNPQQIQAQIHGGATQGMGYGLFEGLKMRDGKIMNNRMSTYIIPSILDVPEIETLHVEPYEHTGAFGMKGVGEISVNAPAPTLSNAIANATGYRSYTLPVTAEKILLKQNNEDAWEMLYK